MQNIHHSLPPFSPYSFFQKLSVLFFPVYVIFFMSVGVEMCTFCQTEWMRPFIVVRLTLKQKTDAFRVRVFMYVSLRVRALSKCAFAYLRTRGARAHMPASRSLRMSRCSTKLHMTSICMQGNSDLITGILFLIKTCRSHQPLSLSSPPFFVFFPFPFPSTSPWHK